MFMDEEAIEKLIEEVEKRPVLFNKLCKEYSDMKLKKIKWKEVTMEVVGVIRWGEMSSEEKTNACKEAQKRWLNLRNCFSRELRLQRENKSAQSAKKRRTYVYFDRLMFLLPTIDPRETSISNDSEDGEVTESSNTKQMRHPHPSPYNKTFERTLLNVLERKNNDERTKTPVTDEDHNFALSLVPMLKRLGDFDKIDAKMKILNIFKEKCAPQPDVRQIRIIKHEKIGSPSTFSPGSSQTQHVKPQKRQASQAHVDLPSPAILPGPSQIQEALPEDRMQSTPSPRIYDANDSVQTYYSDD